MTGECESCQSADVDLVEAARSNRVIIHETGVDRWRICNICYETQVGVVVDYGYADSDVYKTMAQIGNIVLKAIKQISPGGYLMLTPKRLEEIEHWLSITHGGDKAFWDTMQMLVETVNAYKELAKTVRQSSAISPGLDWISEHGGSGG